MIAKIQSTKQLGDGFSTQNGTLYTFGVTLENGDKGVAYAQSTDPWYSAPGTEVLIEDKGEKTSKGTPKWKVKRPDSDKYQGGGAPNTGGRAPKDNKGMEIGMCINKAVDILCATELKENGLNPDTLEDLLFNTAATVYNVSTRMRAFANGEQSSAKPEQQTEVF